MVSQVGDGESIKQQGAGPGRKVTLKDVGSHAHVDPSLVSRILNGDPHISVPEATRRRVLDAVEALRYRPNQAARALATSRSSSLAFLVPQVSSPVYSPIIAGAQQRAFDRGQIVVVAEIGSVDVPSPLAATLDAQRVDGRLLASGTVGDRGVRDLIKQGPPTVVVNRRVRGAPCCVVVDDAAGAGLAASHLIELGHRQLAVVAGPAGVDTSRRRIDGFNSYAGQWQATKVTDLSAGGWTARHGYESALQFLTGRRKFTAVFACTAMLGVGILRAANELGIDVPGELSIIALHDCEFAEYTWPALTSVAMPMEQLGAVAVDQLLALIRGQSPAPHTKIKDAPELVIRRSTAAIGRR